MALGSLVFSPEYCNHLALGRESCSNILLVHLFVYLALQSVFFPSSWCQGLAAACDYDTPWTFLLTFL